MLYTAYTLHTHTHCTGTQLAITYLSDDEPERLIFGVHFEDLLLPILLVVGQFLDELEEPFVAGLSHLTRAVLPPAKKDDVVNNVPEDMELDELPTQAFPCSVCIHLVYTYVHNTHCTRNAHTLCRRHTQRKSFYVQDT